MKAAKRISALIALVGILFASGCASPATTTQASRTMLYSSLEQLSRASDVIVTGSVESQRTSPDIDDLQFTISTFRVDEVVKSAAGLHEGDVVDVRQVGAPSRGEWEAVPPTPLLSAEETYLIYLTESGLPAPLDAQYYVTGSNAGVFQRSTAASEGATDDASFEAVDPSEGEDLPANLTVDDAERAVERR